MKIIIDTIPDGNGKIISANFEVIGIQTKKDAEVAIVHLKELINKLNIDDNHESKTDQ